MTALLSAREKKILLLTGGIVLLTVVYHFFSEPFFKEWRELTGNIQLAEARLQRTHFLLKRKSQIEPEFKKMTGTSLGEGESDEVATEMLQEVERLAQTHLLKILEMRPLPAKRKELFMEQGLEVSVEGTAGQFARFIYALRDTPTSMVIERLELSSKSGPDQRLRGSMLITTIHLPNRLK